jgi:hypothetical protein
MRAASFVVVAALALSGTHRALAESRCMAQSPAHTVALVELYTSEGCDSCPPADRWLGRIGESGIGTEAAVPLSLHVDYWDQLGWKDRFADARYSERQRELSRLAGSRTIYTPEIFVGLHEMRAWSSAAQFRQVVKDINARPARADIRLELEPRSAAKLPLKAEFALKPGAAVGQPHAYVALYENRLSTDVKAGENRGVTLRHEYVVREWLGPIELRGGKASYASTVALDLQWKTADLGVAAFVQDFGSGQMLQAVALPLCR